jgi:hypothetical protein
MAGLLNILPRYLPRFGMAPSWLERRRPLVLLLTGMCLAVNVAFRADVDAQGAAYATGVLVLMASGPSPCCSPKNGASAHPRLFWGVLAVFVYVLIASVWERPEGLKIAGMFIVLTITASVWSRWIRASGCASNRSASSTT